MCQWPNETRHYARTACLNTALLLAHHHPGECADFAYCGLHVQAGYNNLFLFVDFSEFNSGTDKVHGASRGCSQWRTEVGGFGVLNLPLPEIPKALQNCAKRNPTCENC